MQATPQPRLYKAKQTLTKGSKKAALWRRKATASQQLSCPVEQERAKATSAEKSDIEGSTKATKRQGSHVDTGARGLHHPDDARLRSGPATGPPGRQAAGAGAMHHAAEGAAVPGDVFFTLAHVPGDVEPHVEPTHDWGWRHGVKIQAWAGRAPSGLLLDRGDSCAGGARRGQQTTSAS